MAGRWIDLLPQLRDDRDKPDLVLDDQGVCNACRSFENRAAVDWSARRIGLEALLEGALARLRERGLAR